MIARFLLSVTGILCLCGSARLSGQTRSYHMELSDGTSGYVILVNDSSKTIEAFRFRATCETNGRIGGSTSADYDKLWTPGTVGPAPRGHDGRPAERPQPDIIAPGQRMQTLTYFSPQPSGCPRHADIDAVIYSDGTYEGSNDGVRSLQVWRDGVADELQYWSTKLHAPDAEPFDPYAITSEAKRRADTYMAVYRGPNHPFLVDYKLGERQVAGNIALLASGNLSPDELRRRELDFIDRWQKKLDDDVAFTKMNAILPLPVDIVTSAPRSPAEVSAQP